MAWTYTYDGSAFNDWNAVARIKEPWEAVKERNIALGTSGPYIPAAGADVQYGGTAAPASTTGDFSFRWLQGWVEANLGSFAVSHDAGVKRAAGHWDGDVMPVAYANLAEVFSAAGLAHSDWRRKTDLAAWATPGKQQAGDIIGAWLFEDMQKVLNVLIWTIENPAWDRDGDDNITTAADNSGLSVWADFQTELEDDFAAASPGPSGDPPQAGVRASYSLGVFEGAATRLYSFGRISSIDDDVAKAIDWYALIAAHVQGYHESEYDRNDPDVPAGYEDLAYNWTTTTHAAASGTDLVAPTALGDTLMGFPVWCTEPPPDGDDIGYIAGWVADEIAAVARWDVVNGFTYVA